MSTSITYQSYLSLRVSVVKNCEKSPKPLPRILSPESVFPALTQFLSSDHRTLPTHWVFKADNPYLCDVNLLSQENHVEELKISVLDLPWILRRGS
ncbi:hypothetical protein ATANTOWER_027048 [Ataeniobius toweri]|uniref:Uncharacterized protein n=1 Tax=Ataeniobius toweri TaxID=208326 RepID=A0ABU7AZV2_9TELE|nr:hypothetical protein [Ataeniobius toweri]